LIHTQANQKGADIASATALVLGNDGNTFDVTGTTTITSITTKLVGTIVTLHFDAILTLTHDAADLILPGGANITTAAGDEFTFTEYATGDWRCIGYVLASGKAVVGASADLPRSYLAGLGTANNGSDADHDIDISVGEARDDADSEDIVLASGLIKQIDATFVVGTNQGGLDTGAVAADTTYHMYIIKRTDTDVVDFIFSLSASAPTMPANYDKKRKIGKVITDSASNIQGYTQEGDEFLLDDPPLSVDVSDLGTTAVTYTTDLPIGETNLRGIFNVYQQNATLNSRVYVSSLDQDDEAPSQSVAPLLNMKGTNSGGIGLRMELRINSSAQIRARGTLASTIFRVADLGWIDSRGRND